MNGHELLSLLPASPRELTRHAALAKAIGNPVRNGMLILFDVMALQIQSSMLIVAHVLSHGAYLAATTTATLLSVPLEAIAHQTLMESLPRNLATTTQPALSLRGARV